MKKIFLVFFVCCLSFSSCNTEEIIEPDILQNIKTKEQSLLSKSVQAPNFSLPASIASLYESSPNENVSDDFSTLDWNKWTHRVLSGPQHWGTGSDYVKIVDSSFLSIKGKYDTFSTGSGLSALNTSKYGFYVTRWRHVGSLTGWHDAIWTAGENFGQTYASYPNVHGVYRIELDLIERDRMSPPKWNAKVHGWAPGGIHEARVLRPSEEGNEWTNWTVDAVEYHPDYVRAWKYTDGVWTSFDKIYFTNTNSTNSIHQWFRKHNYAIISIKKGVKNLQWPVSDAWLHVDYYMVYDLK
ncbi:hypothetical protein [Polaribacter porphyrae]|uniref:GH16 domain-containing protein n=1 Tax=Polaribacter porphyrae TaxID=1137780 RepID=A0A2S7WQB3_9FLAO|nr:hypothetical protein [Polaribacter porphyrae]PQJ79808.1 hypothetical protein BTO18_11760 [Polaribacter porphyrae]